MRYNFIWRNADYFWLFSLKKPYNWFNCYLRFGKFNQFSAIAATLRRNLQYINKGVTIGDILIDLAVQELIYL